MNTISAEILDLPTEDSSEMILNKLTKSAGVFYECYVL
jgi:hypothetical protein